MSRSTIRNIIISLILFLAAGVVFGVMAYQIDVQGKELGVQIETLESERAQENSYIKLQRIAADTEGERNKLESFYLLEESDSIDFLNSVESLAPKLGVELKTNGLEAITDGQDDWINVRFDLTGSRSQVQQFVEVLETLPYVLKVMDLEMSSRSSTEWNANISVQVQVLTYE